MALIKCPKCGYMNAISFDKCSNCKQNLNFADDTPPQNIAPPIKQPITKERIKTTDKKSHETSNKLKEVSEKLQKTNNKLNKAGSNIQKVGMGCCGTVVWLFVFLVIIGSCSSAIKNKKISSSSSESLKAEIENSKPSEETPIKTEEPQPTQQVETEAPEPSEEYIPIDPLDNFTMSQKNAILQAQSYLEVSSFSRNGLIEQLSSEYGNRYDMDDAIFAVEYLESENKVDWNEQAIKQANSYLESSPFSRQGLIDQLSSEHGSGFTIEEAENAIIYLEDNNSVDWYEQAVRQAESYLESFAFSKQELIDQLSSEHGSQFTIDEAEYGADKAYTDNSKSTSFEKQDITNGNFDNANNFNTYNEEYRQEQTSVIILNTESKIIHNPWCISVPKIAPENYSESNLSVEQLEAQGYEKCGQKGDW